jgi:hypothetical protein
MMRLLTILLLLITIEANVIASAFMTSDMVALSIPSGMHVKDMHDVPNISHKGHHGMASVHCSDSMEMQHASECDSAHNSQEDDDQYHDCGLCSDHYFKAVLTFSLDIPSSGQFEFDSDYTFSGVSVTHPLTLKPPRFI